jgi:hypothetical protein
MAFIVKSGSITVVVPTASEAVQTFEKFMRDDERSKAVISNFEGVKFGIEELRLALNE